MLSSLVLGKASNNINNIAMKQCNNGNLFIVATPIGNLGDITLRAIETLKNVDAIACEDTRVSRVLLDHFGIKKELISLHQHSNEDRISEIIERLNQGQNIAYISDGGTPGISDPGQKLVQNVRLACHPREDGDPLIDCHGRRGDLAMTEKANKSRCDKVNRDPDISESSGLIPNSYNLQAIPVPGPSALTAAVSVSGLVEKEFYFAGFLPKKKGRQTKFIELSKFDVPIVIYESALRLDRTLKDITQYFGEDTEVFIAREMTKMFEEYWGGQVRDIVKTLGEHKLKGEVTLVVKHNNKSQITNRKSQINSKFQK